MTKKSQRPKAQRIVTEHTILISYCCSFSGSDPSVPVPVPECEQRRAAVRVSATDESRRDWRTGQGKGTPYKED